MPAYYSFSYSRPKPVHTLKASGSGPNGIPPTTETACGVAGAVSDSVSGSPSASVNVSVSGSVSDTARSSLRLCSGRDAAVQNVLTELARDPGRTPPGGVDGIRNEDGAMAFRVGGATVTVVASKVGRTGR